MSITLNTYATGDTDYISKMNNDNNTITGAINTLQAATQTSAPATNTLFVSSVLGSSPALIGASSYSPTASGSTISFTAGTAWKPSSSSVVSTSTTTSVSLTGQAAGTYYIALDAGGQPSVTTSNSEAFFSVAWNGTSATGVTQLANYLMTAAEQQALKTSTTNNTTYPSLKARLEAIETLLNTKA